MTRVSRLSVPAFALLACLFAPTATRATGIMPANGDILTITQPNVSPPVDHLVLVRIDPGTGQLDSIVTLPTGNGALAMTVSPNNGMVYVLGQTNLYRVDPCTGLVTTVTPIAGTLLAPSVPNEKIVAHSNGYLYVTRPSLSNGVVRVDPTTGATSLLANPYPTFAVTAMGITEGRDHQLYLATSAATGTVPWVIKTDPTTGAMSVVASGPLANNVRDLAFDTRDSLSVFRVGSAPNPAVYRVDPVAGTVGVLVNTSFVGTNNGWIAGAPDGRLYIPAATGTQYAMYRIDPVARTVTSLTTPQSTVGFFTVAVMRGFSGCPTPVNTSTWGNVKVRYH